MQPYKNTRLTGIFHSFTGTSEEAAKLLEFEGFMIGINGVVTFKKSTFAGGIDVCSFRAHCAWKPILPTWLRCRTGEREMKVPM